MKKSVMLLLAGFGIRAVFAQGVDSMATIEQVRTDSVKRVETSIRLEASSIESDSSGGGLCIGLGVYNQSFENINRALSSHGFNLLDENMTLFTFGFYGLINPRFRMGLEFEYNWSDPATSLVDTSGIGSVNVHGYNVGIKSGYDILRLKKWGLMPVYGARYFSQTYEFNPRSYTFNDVLEETRITGLKIGYSGLLLTAGLNVHFQTQMDKPKVEDGKWTEGIFGFNLEGGIHYYAIRRSNVTLDNGSEMSRYGLYLKMYLFLGNSTSPLPIKK